MVTVDQQSEDMNPGIVCPNCGCNRMPAINTRRQRKQNIRLRSCRDCGQHVWTKEVVTRVVDRKENVTP